MLGAAGSMKRILRRPARSVAGVGAVIAVEALMTGCGQVADIRGHDAHSTRAAARWANPVDGAAGCDPLRDP